MCLITARNELWVPWWRSAGQLGLINLWDLMNLGGNFKISSYWTEQLRERVYCMHKDLKGLLLTFSSHSIEPTSPNSHFRCQGCILHTQKCCAWLEGGETWWTRAAGVGLLGCSTEYTLLHFHWKPLYFPCCFSKKGWRLWGSRKWGRGREARHASEREREESRGREEEGEAQAEHHLQCWRRAQAKGIGCRRV